MATGLKDHSGSMGAGAAARSAAASASPSPLATQCLGEFLRRIDKVDPHPAVLDLGILCGDNIAFLGARGCRVSVESHPAPGAGAVPAAPAGPPTTSVGPATRKSAAAAPAGNGSAVVPATSLQYPAGSFSGILAWDAIARMTPADAVGFVESLRRLLLDGGAILAHFPPVTNSSAGVRYRIVSTDLLALESSTRRCAPPQNFQNREIYSMFSGFEIVRVAQLKSGAREVLVVRKSRNGRE